MTRTVARVLLPIILLGAAESTIAAGTRRSARRQPVRVDLVSHVETVAGEALESNRADDPINPASVVKIGTSMWALERLGPDYRFETRVFARGTVNAAAGALEGDLVVQGSGDPDFQAENAFMIAAELNRLGIRQVRGALIVSRRFWMGWENGSAGVNPDPIQRGLTMAGRLRQALDPRRWNGVVGRSWREYAARHGLPPKEPPRVQVRGGIGVDGERTGELLLVHRSGPLVATLRRFNCFSNNDMERVGADLGPVEELTSLLRVRCEAPEGAISLETSSGLGTNRLTPRLVVRMLHEFRDTCQRVGVPVESVLPVAGCDPGTVDRFFPQLVDGPNATSLVAKTGTLTSTDGGVSVLAGFVNTADGELAFCVASPSAGGKLHAARRAEQAWLLDLIARHGGARPRTCAAPLTASDVGASVIAVATPSAPPVAALAH